MQKTLLHNQSLLDFTLHHCGTVMGIVDIAVENNISITDLLSPGTDFYIPNNIVKENDIVAYYKNKKIIPASNVSLPATQQQDNYLFPNIFPMLF